MTWLLSWAAAVACLGFVGWASASALADIAVDKFNSGPPAALAKVAADWTRWFDAHGGQRRVHLKWYAQMGWGWEAKEDLHVGEFALHVPLRLHLHAGSIQALTPIRAVAADHDHQWTLPGEEPHMLMLSHLLRQPDSFFEPYLTMMLTAFYCPDPRASSPSWLEQQHPFRDCDHPYFWSPREWDQFQTTSAHQVQWRQRNATLHTGFGVMRAFLQARPELGIPAAGYDFSEYAWSYLTVKSRSWDLSLHAVDEQPVQMAHAELVASRHTQAPWAAYNEVRVSTDGLVSVERARGLTWFPGMDVFNHVQVNTGKPHVKLSFADGGLFAAAHVVRPVKKGEQVFTTYSDKPNIALLFGFHFTLPVVSFPAVVAATGSDRPAAALVALARHFAQPDAPVPAYEFQVNASAGVVILRVGMPPAILALPGIEQTFSDMQLDVHDLTLQIDRQYEWLLRFVNVWQLLFLIFLRRCPGPPPVPGCGCLVASGPCRWYVLLPCCAWPIWPSRIASICGACAKHWGPRR